MTGAPGRPKRSRGVLRGRRTVVRRRDIGALSRAELEALLRKEIKRRRDAERNLVEAWRLASKRYIAIRALTKALRQPAPPVRAIRRYAPHLAHWMRLPGHWLRRAAMGVLRVDLNGYHHYPPRPIQLPAHYPDTPAPDPAPKISIVTSSFNAGDFIAATLTSVLDQNYPNLEYVVQDGASKDRTPDIIAAYGDRLASWRSEPDNGFAQGINRGFARTSGEIMAWLNADDLLLPGSLNYVAAYMQAHPEVDVVYGHRIIVNERDEEIGRWVIPPHSDTAIKYADFIPQETMFWRRSLWQRVGERLDEDFRFAIDWDLILRFQAAGATFKRLPRFLGAFRAHEAQKSQAAIATEGWTEMDRLRERALGYAPDHREIARTVRRYKLSHAVLNLRSRVRAARGAA